LPEPATPGDRGARVLGVSVGEWVRSAAAAATAESRDVRQTRHTSRWRHRFSAGVGYPRVGALLKVPLSRLYLYHPQGKVVKAKCKRDLRLRAGHRIAHRIALALGK